MNLNDVLSLKQPLTDTIVLLTAVIRPVDSQMCVCR